MSIHVAPPFAGIPAGEILNVPARDAGLAFAPVDAPAPETLSIRLDRMGVVLALSADEGRTAGLSAEGTGRGTIHLNVAGTEIATCLALLSGRAPAGSTAHSLRDPVVERLSEALRGVEGQNSGADDPRGLYADAVRLAIVTRILSLRERSEVQTEIDEAPATEAPKTSRLKSGLPKWRVKRVMAYIEENLSECVSLAGMADAAGLSRMHFAAQFRIATGVRPHEFLLRRRIEKAQEMMLTTRDPLVEVALAVGFQTQAHFTTVFRRFVGDTPYQWRAASRAAA